MIPITRPLFGKAERDAVARVLASGWVSQGPETAAFENEFAVRVGAGASVAVTSCTTALHLALLLLDIGAGDEVIVPSFTFIATAAAVEYVGAKPVFCDVLPDTYNIDPADFEKKIAPRTRAVIPVHLFGLCADMNAVLKIARRKRLKVIEDAACAIGSMIGKQYAGTFGDTACFSLHPRKNITVGEGGMLTAKNKLLLKRAGELRSHGATISDLARHKTGGYALPEFPCLGYNYRMTDLQAAVGRVQLGRLDEILKKRRALVARYDKLLQNVTGVSIPVVPDGYFHTYQSYVTVLDGSIDRNRVAAELERRGIATRQGTHAVHTLAYYRKKYNLSGNMCPQAKRLDAQSLALPLYAQMKRAEQDTVIEELNSVTGNRKFRR